MKAGEAGRVYRSLTRLGLDVITVDIEIRERVGSTVQMDGSLHGPVAEPTMVTARVEMRLGVTSQDSVSRITSILLEYKDDGWMATGAEIDRDNYRIYAAMRKTRS